MGNKTGIISTSTICCLLFGVSAFAHHSDAEWTESPLITIEGTVTKWEFVNPHMLLHVDVVDKDGNVEKWMIFGAAPNHLKRVGWSQKTFTPGEKLAITGHPSRLGKKTMTHRKIVRENGEWVRTTRDVPREEQQ